MKVVSHVVALGVGFGLGIFVARSGSPPESNLNVAAPPEVEAPAKIAPAPQTAVAVPSTTATLPAGGRGVDMTLLRDDFEQEMGRGNLQQANLILIDMKKADSRSQIYLESQGRYLTRKRDYEMARTALKDCLAAYPKSKSCMVDLASVELQIGTKDEQVEAINKCLAANPTDPQCRNMSGINSMNSGDYVSAIKIYQDLLRDNGSYGFRFNPGMLDWQLALALEGAGRQGEALDHFEKACQVSFSEACDKLEDLSGGGLD